MANMENQRVLATVTVQQRSSGPENLAERTSTPGNSTQETSTSGILSAANSRTPSTLFRPDLAVRTPTVVSVQESQDLLSSVEQIEHTKVRQLIIFKYSFATI